MSRLTKIGLCGTLLSALCCFTPLLVVLFGVLGLGWFAGYLDYMLLPALIIFIGITVYSLLRRR